MNKALLSLVVAVAIFGFYGLSNAGSIILPFWQNTPGTNPQYTLFVVLNTSASTENTVGVMFYGDEGNPQGTEIEKTIPWGYLQLFGTGDAPTPLKMATGNPYGYAICSDSGGMLVAIGLVYDSASRGGYPIPCFGGNDDGEADPGW